MKNYRTISLLGLFCMLLFSCRTDEFTDTINTPIFVETNLSGVVMDTDHQPISEAIVSISGITAETDQNGVFNFRNIELLSDGSLVKVFKTGYFDGFIFADGQPGDQSYLETILIERQAQEFQSSTGGTITMNGGATITFEPNSIVTGGGSPYSGIVEISTHYYDPSSDETAFTMPGDLRAIDQNTNFVQLMTFGMMAVELRNPSGVELQLAPESKATLNFPIPSESDFIQNELIPMWYLDEDSGTWIEEGSAIVKGNLLVGEVSHFSFWNCDLPFPVVNITGSLVAEDGTPLSFQTIVIKDNNNNISRSGSTNSRGIFTGKVPANVNLTLYHFVCDGARSEEDLGILTSDTDIGQIIVNTQNSISLSAILRGCGMESITNGYVKISTSSSNKIITTDEDGNLDYRYFYCNENEVTLRAYDLTSAMVSEPVVINTSETEQDLGTLYLCDSIPGEFIWYTINGVPHSRPLDQIEVYLVDNRILYIYADQEFDASANDPSSLVFKYDIVNEVAQYNPRGYTSSGQSLETSGNNLEVEISAIGGLGTEVHMSFDNGVFEGEMNVYIDKVLESCTVSGKVWKDANQNGLQDPGEQAISGKRISITYIPIPNHYNIAGYSLYPQSNIRAVYVFSDSEGIFEFTGVNTEFESRLTFKTNSGETLTTENVGNDDTIDSDFYDRFNTVDQYNTDDFTIEPGGEKTDLGLGLK